jgi:hypothetical protein
VSEAAAPVPMARLEFHTEPHPNPLVQSLVERIEELMRENQALREKLNGTDSR